MKVILRWKNIIWEITLPSSVEFKINRFSFSFINNSWTITESDNEFFKKFLELISKCSLKESIEILDFDANETPVMEYIEIARTLGLSEIDISALNSDGGIEP